MAITTTMLFWPTALVASALLGAPVLVLRTGSNDPPKKTCSDKSEVKIPRKWQKKPPHPEAKLSPRHDGFGLDYSIGRQEAGAQGTYGGHLDLVENRLSLVSAAAAPVESKPRGALGPVNRSPGPGYKLRINVHEAERDRVLIEINYEEVSLSGGRVTINTTALAKPGEVTDAHLDFPGGGRDLKLVLKKL